MESGTGPLCKYLEKEGEKDMDLHGRDRAGVSGSVHQILDFDYVAAYQHISIIRRYT